MLTANQLVRSLWLYLLFFSSIACTDTQVSEETDSSTQTNTQSTENLSDVTEPGSDRIEIPELGISLIIPSGYEIKRSGSVIYIKKVDSKKNFFLLYSRTFSDAEAIKRHIYTRGSSLGDVPTPLNESEYKNYQQEEPVGPFKNQLIGDISNYKSNGNEVIEAKYQTQSLKTGESSKWYLTYVVYKRTNKKLFALSCNQSEPDSLARKVLFSVKPL